MDGIVGLAEEDGDGLLLLELFVEEDGVVTKCIL